MSESSKHLFIEISRIMMYYVYWILYEIEGVYNMNISENEQIYLKAGYALEEGKRDEAISLYKKAADMGYVKAYFKLGDIYNKSGETELAKDYYYKAREADPNDGDVQAEVKTRLENAENMSSYGNSYGNYYYKADMHFKRYSRKISVFAVLFLVLFILLSLILALIGFLMLSSILTILIGIVFISVSLLLLLIGGGVYVFFRGYSIIVQNHENQIIRDQSRY